MNRRSFLKAVPAVALALCSPLVFRSANAAQTWRPDFCFGGPCRIEVDGAFAFIAFLGKCPAHESIQTAHTLTDAQLFAAIRQSGRRKEVARWATRLYRNIEEDVQFTVDADGTIHVITGLNGQQQTTLTAQIQMVLAGVEAPVGTVSIVVD